MKFGITNPCCPEDFWENIAFNAYTFHQDELDDVVFQIVNADDPNDSDFQNYIFNNYTLCLNQYDMDYIITQVQKVWPNFILTI